MRNSLRTIHGAYMFCSKCGSAIAANTAFCQACGNAIQPALAAAPLAQGALPVASAGAVSPHWLPPVTRAYAGFWLRFVAHIIDSLLLGVVVMAIVIPLGLLSGVAGFVRSIRPNEPPDPAVIMAFVSSMALLAGLSILGSWLYNAYFESSEWQGTLGKKALNLIVTDMDGNRISFGRASGRFFAKIISGLI
ncbi:MAG TPA: RDD family protein, partial [Candidatus Acidoferrum sp.]